MRLRLCGYCDAASDIEPPINSQSVVSSSFRPPQTTQPQQAERIELNNLSLSSRPHMPDHNKTNPLPATEIQSVPQDQPCFSITSNFSYITKNGTRSNMSFEQIGIKTFRGYYKKNEFVIVDGKFESGHDRYNEAERKLILTNYYQTVLAMEQGKLREEDRTLYPVAIDPSTVRTVHFPIAKHPTPLNLKRLSEVPIPTNTKVNINFTSDNGDKYKMTFKQLKPGLFRGTFNDKKYSVANGQVFSLDGNITNFDRELIQSSFYRALLGIQQTKFAQDNEWVIETSLPENQINPLELLKAACPEKRARFELESLLTHNYLRSIHGVPNLIHSEFLSELARGWAEHLALKDKSFHNPNVEYGENLHFSQGEVLSARKVVIDWYNEINLYDYNMPQLSKETSHFTQIVWRDTKEIGTGMAQIGDKIWICCYYNPPGNIPAQFNAGLIPRACTNK